MPTDDSMPKAPLWKTTLKIAFGYSLFVGVACVMTVVGLILIPVGLVAYILAMPFRRRSGANVG